MLNIKQIIIGGAISIGLTTSYAQTLEAELKEPQVISKESSASDIGELQMQEISNPEAISNIEGETKEMIEAIQTHFEQEQNVMQEPKEMMEIQKSLSGMPSHNQRTLQEIIKINNENLLLESLLKQQELKSRINEYRKNQEEKANADGGYVDDKGELKLVGTESINGKRQATFVVSNRGVNERIVLKTGEKYNQRKLIKINLNSAVVSENGINRVYTVKRGHLAVDAVNQFDGGIVEPLDSNVSNLNEIINAPEEINDVSPEIPQLPY